MRLPGVTVLEAAAYLTLLLGKVSLLLVFYQSWKLVLFSLLQDPSLIFAGVLDVILLLGFGLVPDDALELLLEPVLAVWLGRKVLTYFSFFLR